MHDFWDSAAGGYLKAWEMAQMERSVADIFGFHALQLGSPKLPVLSFNRMPHRWLSVAQDSPQDLEQVFNLACDPAALPFSQASLDLVVMPHTLELHNDPHAVLREVSRVLVPDGKVVISGFNPNSLWGYFKSVKRYLPPQAELIGYWRLRDWLKLLGFEINCAGFGCYLPYLSHPDWIQRLRLMDVWGPKWWPIFGSVYLITAVKRVQGVRLIESRKPKVRKSAVRIPLANQSQPLRKSQPQFS
jgi:SAM-dependent methyltransferase